MRSPTWATTSSTCLRCARSAWPIAVANARERVKAEAHYVTPNSGGYGAGRDAVEFILEAKGVLDKCIECVYRRKQSDFAVDGYWQAAAT